MVALNDVAELIDYGVTASANTEAVGPKFLRITDIQDGAVNWDTVPYCEADARRLRTSRLAVGDIVFARTGATTGKSFLIRSCPESAVFASYLIRVRPSVAVHPEFLAQFFDSQGYWDQINLKSAGAAQPGVNASKLAELEIPLPPLEEQKRIAAILDQADALRRLRARALTRLNALGQAIFHEMFGDFSDGKNNWPLARLGNLIESAKIGLVRGASEQGDDRPVKYLRMDAIGQDGTLDLAAMRRVDANDREREEFSVIPGDLLFNTRNSRELVGKTAVVRRPFDGVYNNNILRLRFADGLNSSFLDAYLRTQAGSSALDTIKSGTTSVFAIYQKTLLELQVPTPPPELQMEFEDRLDALLGRVALSEVAMSKSETLFTSLQHRAFRGEL